MSPNKLKSALRRTTPQKLWNFLGFLYRLKNYYRIDQSRDLQVKKNLDNNSIFINKSTYIVSPSDTRCFFEWSAHCLERPESRSEISEFLQIINTKKKFLDIGAQTGLFSAIFSKYNNGPVKILSVEPDSSVIPFLENTKNLNKGVDTDWSIKSCFLSDLNGEIDFHGVGSNRSFHLYNDQVFEKTKLITLQDFLIENKFCPDVIKIDVESYEYEIITSSLTIIEKIRPSLQLEIHWEMLRKRGRDPSEFLKPLSDIGYRGAKRRYRTLKDWQRLENREPVSRLSLIP